MKRSIEARALLGCVKMLELCDIEMEGRGDLRPLCLSLMA